LKESIVDILRAAVKEAALRTDYVGEESLPPIVVEEPRASGHGDFSTNVAMLVAGKAKVAAKEVAEAIASKIDKSSARLDKVEVKGPGFVNMYLDPCYLQDSVASIVQEGEKYGTLDFGGGSPVQVEFVSANPTGPLNVVSARAAAVGDSLIRIFKACGYDAKS
jgi:arginyl-tRNA synthetase